MNKRVNFLYGMIVTYQVNIGDIIMHAWEALAKEIAREEGFEDGVKNSIERIIPQRASRGLRGCGVQTSK
jgi:hypothetical protein